MTMHAQFQIQKCIHSNVNQIESKQIEWSPHGRSYHVQYTYDLLIKSNGLKCDATHIVRNERHIVTLSHTHTRTHTFVCV